MASPPLCSFCHGRFTLSFSTTIHEVLLYLLLLSTFLSSLPDSVLGECKNPPVIFNFGDSNSDTGGLVAGLGYSINFPNGRTFFRRSTGRLSDGRLIIDFLCQSVDTTFLSPYLDSMGSTFLNGANFAIAGSLHFIGDAGFRNGLYVIDIGQNDLADSFAKNLSYKEVVKKIPSVILEIKYAVEDIYAQGGRKFWVHNTGPLGCLPQKLSTVQKAPDDLDPYGCISSYNDAARVFNEALLLLCEELRYEKKDATIVYVDVYTIKYDLIANSTKYGFSSPLMACCGFGGPPYNYDVRVTCGHPGYQVCDEDSKYVSWDGIHYTEAANSIIASKILSTDYSTPRIAFDYFCN
ncbi:GDSL esterase/lipase At1g09390 isoform X2 [Coffea eugenioides]|uniref:GDSL esterase/lipase At1g09390 isoform X2 n=1 Tax=Coffea eugenioides TaxID=49369 RepID=UPI000F610A3B|nr:GDSL esterase/lipase At1g09390 isoform X2 [Coffea eugenioides]